MSCEDDVVISARSIGKNYRLFNSPQERLKNYVSARFGKTYGQDFWALRGVSFEVRRGETFGIIGRNGSGKSTLLQLLAGILKPTEGELVVRGKVAGLLELGSGFNPELTGRENVFLQGAVLGVSRESLNNKLAEILDFADIGSFVDQPVKFYSSGMFVRLAFAVATSVEADILVIDEALAVGDVFFRQKCYERLEKLRVAGTAILLVSHSMSEVQEFCPKAILLQNGYSRFVGATLEAVNLYYLAQSHGEATDMVNSASNNLNETKDLDQYKSDYTKIIAQHELMPAKKIMGSGYVTCLGFQIFGDNKIPRFSFSQGEKLTVIAAYQSSVEIEIPVCGLVLRNEKNLIVHGKDSLQFDYIPVKAIEVGEFLIVEQTVSLNVAPGEYTLELGFASTTKEVFKTRHNIPYEEVMAQVKEQCILPNCASISVHCSMGKFPASLSHHGLCDLPGSFNITLSYELKE